MMKSFGILSLVMFQLVISLIASYIIIKAFLNGWNITLSFNNYGEGFIELIAIIGLTGAWLVYTVKHIRGYLNGSLLVT